MCLLLEHQKSWNLKNEDTKEFTTSVTIFPTTRGIVSEIKDAAETVHEIRNPAKLGAKSIWFVLSTQWTGTWRPPATIRRRSDNVAYPGGTKHIPRNVIPGPTRPIIIKILRESVRDNPFFSQKSIVQLTGKVNINSTKCGRADLNPLWNFK